MNEEEAIVYFKNYIKVKKEVIKERQKEGWNADSKYTQQLEEMVEAFETVLNLLENKDIDIIEAKEANRQLSIELQKKDKIIDLIAKELVKAHEWFYSEFDNYTKEDFIKYFEKKVEEDN